jgi:hypothetical protein
LYTGGLSSRLGSSPVLDAVSVSLTKFLYVECLVVSVQPPSRLPIASNHHHRALAPSRHHRHRMRNRFTFQPPPSSSGAPPPPPLPHRRPLQLPADVAAAVIEPATYDIEPRRRPPSSLGGARHRASEAPAIELVRTWPPLRRARACSEPLPSRSAHRSMLDLAWSASQVHHQQVEGGRTSSAGPA